MRGLESLIRIHKSKLEAERRKLAELEALAAGFTRQIETLRETAAAEGRAPEHAPDAAHAIGRFVQGALARIDTLRASREEVRREMAVLQERIRTAFQELKRFEIAAEQRAARARAAVRRRERIVEDEIGLTLHRRRERLTAG